MLRPAVEDLLLVVRAEREAKLGGDHHLVSYRSERRADDFLVDVGAIDLGGIEEIHATIGRGPDQ
ncbi:hypothetical protein D3C71_2087870 [compost metagenome]